MATTPSHPAATIVSRDNLPNDRAAFARRQSTLEQFVIENINPLEQQILVIREQLIPLYDTMNDLREQMLQHCTHPKDQLDISEAEDMYHVSCKVCFAKFTVPK